ncbi:3-hydroxyanthranilate 3,4-dioxygenase-like [Artemia franciscana]|uniref:3-hydroxyanthranilate 3,4-dioxygenase-like n=1 Tax=Artemia franciscana TaxID=6661 RepID=UPI0032D9F842
MKNGDMDLYVMEKGIPRKITIKQGEVFVLPARIPMSPQRYSNTVGLRVERSRTRQELDCIRFYTKDNSDVLYERWFKFTEPKDIQPVIDDFFASEESKIGIPSKNSKLMVAPYEPNEKLCVGEPFSLEQWLDRNSQRLNNGKLDLFQGEFKAEVIVYGTGKDEVVNKERDTFIWAIHGTSFLDVAGEATRILEVNDTGYIRRGRRYKIMREDGARVLQITFPHNQDANDWQRTFD